MPTPEELSAQLEASQKEAEKQKGIAENAEKLVQKWSNEVGELRKQAKASEDKTAALEAELVELKKKILGAEEQGKKKTQQEEREETPDEIEASLSEEQRKAAEAAYKAATPEVKKKINEDEETRKAFFKEARERVQVVPEFPWKKPAEKKKAVDESAKVIGGLFDAALKRERNLPPGGSGAGFRAGGSEEQKPTRPKIQGGQGFLKQFK